MTNKREIEKRLDGLEKETESSEGFEMSDEKAEEINEIVDVAIDGLNEQGLDRLDGIDKELQEIDDLTTDEGERLAGEFWGVIFGPRYKDGDVYRSEPRYS